MIADIMKYATGKKNYLIEKSLPSNNDLPVITKRSNWLNAHFTRYVGREWEYGLNVISSERTCDKMTYIYIL